MTDELRKAAEMALEKLDHLWEIAVDERMGTDVLPEIKALRQALAQPEQECLYPECETAGGCDGPCGEKPVDTVNKLQPEQEPVAWMNPRNNAVIDARKKKQIGEGDGYPRFSVPLYAQPVDEIAKRGHDPVAWITRRTGDGGAYVDGYECCEPTDYGAFPVYTAPPKRDWVGLTDEELELINDCGDTDSLKFARAIEAKLKEKNT